MGRHPWPLEPCGAASRSARPRVSGYALAPSRVAAARRRAGPRGRQARRAAAGTSTHHPAGCDPTRRPAVVSLSRFLCVLSRLSCTTWATLYRTTDYAAPTEVRRSRLTHRAANTNRAHTPHGGLFSRTSALKACTGHRRLSTFEYARPRSAWISHDYIPPPAANTLQSR